MTDVQTPVKQHSLIYLLVKNSGQFFALHVPRGLPSSIDLSFLVVGIRVSYAEPDTQYSIIETSYVRAFEFLTVRSSSAHQLSRSRPHLA